jgi:Penicillin amidase
VSSVGRVINVLAALLVSAAVLVLFAVGYGPVPALGRALVPGHGAWASAPGGQPIHSQTLSLPGLAHPVSVAFTSHGVASVHAADEADAYLALGYLHARFRLTEMDLERRLGEGRIAQLAGPAGLSSDKFELRLGLLRTAQAEWAATPRTSPAAQVLMAYSRGVNDYLAQARRTGQWPSLDPHRQPRPPGHPHPAARLHHHPPRLRHPRTHSRPPPHHGLVPHTRARPWHPLRPRPLQTSRPRPHRSPSGPGTDRGNNGSSQGIGCGRTGSGKGAGAGAVSARSVAAGSVIPTRLGHYGGHHRRRQAARRGPGVRPRLQHRPDHSRGSDSSSSHAGPGQCAPAGPDP